MARIVVSDSVTVQPGTESRRPANNAQASPQSRLGPALTKATQTLREGLSFQTQETKRIEDVCRVCQQSQDATRTAQVDAAFELVLTILDVCVNLVNDGQGSVRDEVFQHVMEVANVLQDEAPEPHSRLDSIYRSLEAVGKAMARHRSYSGGIDLALGIEFMDRALKIVQPGSLAETIALLAASRLYEARYHQHGCSNPQADLDQALATLQKVVAQGPQNITEDALDMLSIELACLRLRFGQLPEGLEELKIQAEQLVKEPLSLADLRPFRFRFIHCRSFVEDSTIRILAFDRLPEDRYSAISYVWQGLDVDETTTSADQFMVVKGAEEADPISLAVLRSACLASLQHKCEMIWLDRLGIVQVSASDKAWQIKHMFRIYQSCRCCLVLPGGLARLASVDEETSWMDRAWTLQEAVAPPAARVIFAWPWGTATQVFLPQPPIAELEPGRSADVDLKAMLSSGGLTMDMPTTFAGDRPYLVNNLFGDKFSYATVVLQNSMGSAGPERSVGIWRSSFLRTSSRPVDMVFSIMGLLGVTLEPSAFQVGGRRQALTELARTLLSQGEGAHWLGLFLDIAPDPAISWLPAVPKTSVAGKAYIETPRGLEAIKDLVQVGMPWFLDETPRGVIDAEGYFTFEAKAAAVQTLLGETGAPGEPAESARKDVILQNPSGQRWVVSEERASGDVQHGQGWQFFCIVISRRKPMTLGYIPYWMPVDSVVMIVQRSGRDTWCCLGYGLAHDALMSSRPWVVRRFTVGGPPNAGLGPK